MARPRSIQAHDAVMAAARDLFADRGIDATSMDAIAHASGVSKATIYKHWPDKDALCLEVMAQLHGFEEMLPETNTGTVRSDLLAVMGRTPPAEYADIRQRILPHFFSHAVKNPAFGKAWRLRVLEPPRAALIRILERSMDRGELRDDVNLDFALGLLQGPPMYWYMRNQHFGQGPNGFDAHLLVDAFLRALGASPAPAGREARRRGPRRRTQ